MSFIKQLKHIHNTGLSRSVVLTGNIYDLFWDAKSSDYVPLIRLLQSEIFEEPTEKTRGITQAVCELNNSIEFVGNKDEAKKVWEKYVNDGRFDLNLETSGANATFSLDMLRQLCMGYNNYKKNIKNNLICIVESSDMLVPDVEISRMNLNDRKRVAIIHDWFSDPDFMNGSSSVILLSESRSSLHSRIARLPQVVSVEINLPDLEERERFVRWFREPRNMSLGKFSPSTIAELTSGLSIHAIRQLLLSGDLSHETINKKVEEYMESQLGDGVVEFKRPNHSLKSIVGNRRIKPFIKDSLIPGFLNGTIRGAAVGGPIGSGKTYICEAIAAELGIPVITLKNIRSRDFGGTDIIFERLRRLLESFHRVMIFVDEADTQFGGVSVDVHPTERRLTGKIQAMMSDPKLKGRVLWFLMTARINLLSPDIRRPGRVDVIIPILDPETDDDRDDFLKWITDCFEGKDGFKDVKDIDATLEAITKDYSAASFDLLRSMVKNVDTFEELLEVANDMITPDIDEVREYQTLQAKLNCTRASLMFDNPSPKIIKEKKLEWKRRVQELESMGIS